MVIGKALVLRCLLLSSCLLGSLASVGITPARAAEANKVPVPATYRIEMTGTVNGKPFGPLAGSLTLEPPAGRDHNPVAVVLATDAVDQPGALLWYSFAEIPSSEPVHTEVALDGTTLTLRLVAAGPGAVPSPLVSFAFGQLMAGVADFAHATTGEGRLQFNGREVEGEIELSGRGVYRTPATCSVHLTGRLVEAADRVPDEPPRTSGSRAAAGGEAPAADAAPAEAGGEQGSMPLRDTAYGLVLSGRCEEAVEMLEEARRQVRAEWEAEDWETMRDSHRINERNVLVRLMYCQTRLGDFEAAMEALVDYVEIDRELAGKPYLARILGQTAETAMPQALAEAWRQRMTDDRGRIGALEGSQVFFDAYLSFLFELGRGADEGLFIAEAARARALGDLRAQRHGESTDRPPLPLSAIREVARKRGETIVEYFVGEDSLFIWVVDPEGGVWAARTDTPKRELAALVGRFVDLIDDSRADADRRAQRLELLRDLYDRLFGPIPQDRLPPQGKRLTVIPHSYLFRVPFAALRAGDGPDDYLVHRWALTHAPSITLLGEVSEQPRKPPAELRLLALVNPRPLPQRLAPLTETEDYFSMVTGHYPVNHRLLTGTAATEEALRTLAPGHDVLYLATHGSVSPGELSESYVVLGKAGGDDGLLWSEEILDLDLKAELVILSACRVERGELTSDGVYGLGRAFFAAGARGLVTSLWSIPEFPSLKLLGSLHEHWLATGGTLAEALRKAQSAAAHESPAEPEFWAGLVLIGGGA